MSLRLAAGPLVGAALLAEAGGYSLAWAVVADALGVALLPLGVRRTPTT